MSSFSAIALLLAAQAPVFDRAALMTETAARGFVAAEEPYVRAAGDPAGALRLAQFYMANEMWPEALAVLERTDSHLANDLSAECAYRMGRYRNVVLRLEGSPGALLAMALARLGAYAEARAAFDRSPPPHASRNLGRDYLLLKAETLIETGEAAKGSDFVRKAGEADAHSRFLLARAYAAEGETGRSALFLRSAAAGGDEWAMRARLALAAKDVSAIEALSLGWQGGAFERELQLALGRLRLDGRDYDRGFAALHIVVDRYPRSDAALAASGRIAQSLPTLFAGESDLDPRAAARLFFENVEFAPPGHDGDRLIQEAVRKLKALALYAPAAQILNHQVMKRLRGVERSTVAVDLAELYVQAQQPGEALRALRSTRHAGLPADVVAKRRRLEARALALTGRAEAAVALLNQSPSTADVLLRAEIHWSAKDWPASARDYAAYLAAAPSLTANRDRAAAVRAATAFLLAGDRAGYRAFAKEIELRLEGTPEAALIATLGDVDRERFLAGFMESYRSVYGEAGS